MDPYVTHIELSEAIDRVEERIDATEEKLREEFRTAFQFEISRFDSHLFEQDHALKWINRWALSALVTILGAVLYIVLALHK